MTDRSFDTGPIRPPSEANSLLLQVTQGCTWNKCRFCVVYRGQGFRMLQPEHIRRNIDNMAYFRDLIYSCADSDGRVDREKLIPHLEEMNARERQCFYIIYNWVGHGARNVFLQDGNSVALKPEKLADVLFYLREKFPTVERVTTYGRASTLARYSVGQLKLLRESGLNRVHTGFESGSDQVLAMINKGLTQEQQIEAGRKTVEAGIELSVYFMPGIGGRRYSQENADETAYVVNQIRPDFVRLRTFILKLESEMYEMKRRGEFEECTDLEKLGEIRRLIAGIDAPETRIVSDHIVNLIGTLSGRIGTDKEAMLAQADEVLSLPVTEQRIYQNFRRHGLVDNYLQMKTQVSPQQFEHMRQYAEGFESDEDWEDYMNEILRQYV